MRTAIGRQIQGPERITPLGDVSGQQLGFGDRGTAFLNGQPFKGDPSNLYEFARFQQDQQANTAEQDYLGQYRRGVLDNQVRDALRDQQLFDQSAELFPIRQQRERAGLDNTLNTIDVRNQRLSMTQEDRELKRRIDEETRAAARSANSTSLRVLGPRLGMSQEDADALGAVAGDVSPEQFNALLTQYRLSRETGGDGGEVVDAANKAWGEAVEDRFRTQTDDITARIKEIDAALQPVDEELDFYRGDTTQPFPAIAASRAHQLRAERNRLIKQQARLVTRMTYRWRSGYPRSVSETSPLIGEDIATRIAQQVAAEASEEFGVPPEAFTPEQQAEVQARTERELTEMGWKP